MSYLGFLLAYLVIPIGLLLVVHGLEWRKGRKVPASFRLFPAWQVILLLCLLALVYTTPWDNYLVATQVWGYDPQLVTGLLIGWVPVEEYLFFILQPVFTGLVFLWLAKRLPVTPQTDISTKWSRVVPASLLIIVIFLTAFILASGWQPTTYIALLFVWALPPLLLQVAFGGDILWRARKPVGWTIALTTLYLALVDGVAIDAGTWRINPQQSLPILIGGVLPLEEALFFFTTNSLITIGIALFLSPLSRERLDKMLPKTRWQVIRGK